MWPCLPHRKSVWINRIGTQIIKRLHSNEGGNAILSKCSEILNIQNLRKSTFRLSESLNSQSRVLFFHHFVSDLRFWTQHFTIYMNTLQIQDILYDNGKWKVTVLGAQLSLTLRNPMDCSPPGSSVHGILQVKILKWVAFPFSRGSSQPRDQTQVSCIAGRFFTIWAIREAHGMRNKAILERIKLFLSILPAS